MDERALDHLEDGDFLSLFQSPIPLPPQIYALVRAALKEDVLALKTMGSTDYSLLIGIRTINPQYELATDQPIIDAYTKKLILCVNYSDNFTAYYVVQPNL